MSTPQCTSVALELGAGIINAELRFVDGKPAGVWYRHACAEGKARAGWIYFEGPSGWKLERADPLTVSPSLACRSCSHNGFIRDGKWVPA